MKHIGSYLAKRQFPEDNPSSGIRRLKNGDWYWIGKSVLHEYGPRIGAYGLAVYNVLASFANAYTQESYPSHGTIAKLIGASERSVARKLRMLEKLGLIQIERVGNRTLCRLLEIPKTENPSNPALGDSSSGMEPEDGPQDDSSGTSEPEQPTENTEIDDRNSATGATQIRTNNNNRTRINNHRRIGSIFVDPCTFKPSSQEELLAVDIANALDDTRHLFWYLFYARRYPEPLLRKVLAEIKGMPSGSIRKPIALFNFLLSKHAKEADDNTRH